MISMQSYKIISIALLVLSLPVSALETAIDLGLGLEHTNNALKSSVDKKSELEQIATAGLGLNHEGPSITAEIGYSVEFRAYDKNTQSDETALTGDALIVYEQIDQRLRWTLENSRRSILSDSELSNIQSNREDRSITSISPELILRPSRADAFVTKLTYSVIDYEESEQQDSDRAEVSLSWQRRMSALDTASINISYQDIGFDNGPSVFQQESDYEYYQGSVGYSAELSQLNYSLNLGYNESLRDSGDIDGGYVRAEASYEDGSSRWSVLIGQELTDTSQQNGNYDLSGLGDFTNSSGGVDVFERRNVDLTYSGGSVCAVCTVSVSLLYKDDDYEQLGNDTDEYAIRTSFGYRITRLLESDISAGARRISYGDDGRDGYDLTEVEARIVQSMLKLSIEYSLGYENRESDDVNNDYEEVRGGISISYRFN